MLAWPATRIVLVDLSKMKMLEVYSARGLKMRDRCMLSQLNVRSFKTDIGISTEAAAKTRDLDDEELDSGDDEERRDRLEDGDRDANGEGLYERRENILKASIGRNAGPRPSDGEVRVTRGRYWHHH